MRAAGQTPPEMSVLQVGAMGKSPPRQGAARIPMPLPPRSGRTARTSCSNSTISRSTTSRTMLLAQTRGQLTFVMSKSSSMTRVPRPRQGPHPAPAGAPALRLWSGHSGGSGARLSYWCWLAWRRRTLQNDGRQWLSTFRDSGGRLRQRGARIALPDPRNASLSADAAAICSAKRAMRRLWPGWAATRATLKSSPHRT